MKLVHKGQLVHKVKQEHRVKQEHKELMVLKVQLDKKDKKVK